MTHSTRLMAGAALFLSSAAGAAEVPAPSEVTYGEYGAVAESLIGEPGDPAEGAKVMSDRSLGNCVACHQVRDLADVPFQGNVGPTLDGVGDRWTEADLRGIVANPKKTFPGTIMPAFYKNEGYVRPGDGFTGKAPEEQLDPLLTAEQVEDVVAYLLTLKES